MDHLDVWYVHGRRNEGTEAFGIFPDLLILGREGESFSTYAIVTFTAICEVT